MTRAAGKNNGRRFRKNDNGRQQRRVQPLTLSSPEFDTEEMMYDGDDIEGERVFHEEADGDEDENEVDPHDVGRELFPGQNHDIIGEKIPGRKDDGNVSHQYRPPIVSPTFSVDRKPDFVFNELETMHASNSEDNANENDHTHFHTYDSLSSPAAKATHTSAIESLSPVLDLLDAFMDFTLESPEKPETEHCVTPCATSSVKQGDHEEDAMIPIATPSPIHEHHSAPSSIEHVTTPETSPPKFLTTCNPDKIFNPAKILNAQPTSDNCKTIASLPEKKLNKEFISPALFKEHSTHNNSTPMHKITKRTMELTPLSQAIINGHSTKSNIADAMKNIQPTQSYTTPKRKPRGANVGSSKRQKKTPTNILEKKSKASSTSYPIASEVRPQLYNGRAIERIKHVKKCKDAFCRWDPSLHSRKGACERCWTLASEAERNEFIGKGGRHLRITVVKGGCPPSCKLFSHRVAVSENSGENLYEEAVRLCRRCFDDMHHVGIR